MNLKMTGEDKRSFCSQTAPFWWQAGSVRQLSEKQERSVNIHQLKLWVWERGKICQQPPWLDLQMGGCGHTTWPEWTLGWEGAVSTLGWLIQTTTTNTFVVNGATAGALNDQYFELNLKLAIKLCYDWYEYDKEDQTQSQRKKERMHFISNDNTRHTNAQRTGRALYSGI